MKKLFLQILRASFMSICIIFALQLQSSADSIEIENCIEALLGASRGPLAMLSHLNKDKQTGLAKSIHCLASAVRIAHEINAIINHKDDGSYLLGIRGSWIAFDAVNFYNDLFPKNKVINEPCTQEATLSKQVIERLITLSQLTLLPYLESAMAICQAVLIEKTDQTRMGRRHAQALCSLARATSIVLNNRESKAAIALLIAALGETMLVIGKQIQLDNAPVTQRTRERGQINQASALDGQEIPEERTETTLISQANAAEAEQRERERRRRVSAQQEQIRRDGERMEQEHQRRLADMEVRLKIRQNFITKDPTPAEYRHFRDLEEDLVNVTTEQLREFVRHFDMNRNQRTPRVKLKEMG